MVWFSHHFKFFKQFVVIPTDKGFGLKNEAEVDFFFFLRSLAFLMISWMLLI